MSKLFDQLNDAARERQGSLLLDAMAKKRQVDGAAAAHVDASPEPATAPPASPSPPPTAPAAAEHRSGISGTSFGGVALAAAIFGVAVVAWHSAPWRAPQKVKIDPDGLKLERKLDLERTPPKGTTPPSRPS